MKSAEGRGRTLDEAVDAALIELQESRRNVDVKILIETAEETVVEVTVIDQSAAVTGAAAATPANGKAETARTLVEGLLKHMGVRALVQVRPSARSLRIREAGSRGNHCVDDLVACPVGPGKVVLLRNRR